MDNEADISLDEESFAVVEHEHLGKLEPQVSIKGK